MGLLLNNDRLFQSLLTEIKPAGSEVAADLDVDSFDAVPFITHNSLIAQDRNGAGLWTVQLNVNLFVGPENPFPTVNALYEGIWSWDQPQNGVVAGIGHVVEVTDGNAFSRLGAAQMLNKVVTQYVGSFRLTVRSY